MGATSIGPWGPELKAGVDANVTPGVAVGSQRALVTAGHTKGGAQGVTMFTEFPSTFLTTAMRLGKSWSTTRVYVHVVHN